MVGPRGLSYLTTFLYLQNCQETPFCSCLAPFAAVNNSRRTFQPSRDPSTRAGSHLFNPRPEQQLGVSCDRYGLHVVAVCYAQPVFTPFSAPLGLDPIAGWGEYFCDVFNGLWCIHHQLCSSTPPPVLAVSFRTTTFVYITWFPRVKVRKSRNWAQGLHHRLETRDAGGDEWKRII